MQSQPAIAGFNCRNTCHHKECQRHATMGLVDQRQMCPCMNDLNTSSIFLENVMDLAHTLAQIMVICGIHECKAKSTVDVTTYAFLHYDQVCYCIEQLPRKRLRKEDLFYELGKKCLMNRVEATMAYTVIKRGFKAFYYKPKIFDLATDENGGFSSECIFVHAAKKTAESYARYDGLTCDEQRGIEAKVKIQYKKFYDRMQSRLTQPEGELCNCCFCAKKRGHLVYGKKPPTETKPPKPKEHRCPHCCRKKGKDRSMIHPGRPENKCPVCHRLSRFCICEQYKFTLNFIKSIWERTDFDLYHKYNIEAAENRGELFIPCGIEDVPKPRVVIQEAV